MSSIASAFSGLSWPGRIGYAMSALLAVNMAANAGRALLTPEAFAAYLGAPLFDPRDIGFVLVYAFRAAFFALFVGVLVLRGDIGTLRLLALIGLVMPLGDAWLTWRHGAGDAFAIRHLIVAGVLVLTWFLLGLRARTA